MQQYDVDLDENHIKHHATQLEWRRDNQILLIHDIQYAMRKIRKGSYNKTQSQQMTDLVQRYVDLEKFHREELKAIISLYSSNASLINKSLI